MELKEYLKIIKENSKVFWAITMFFVMASVLYFEFKPVRYDSSLTISISRKGIQSTSDYRYDDFYRLQADEKFADTVVQWLKSPRIVFDIFSEAGVSAYDRTLKQLSKSLKPEKLSSQVVEVSFSSPEKESALRISGAITKKISENTELLNKDQKEDGWFEIIPHDPIVIKNETNFSLAIILSLASGLFLAFWAVLLIHYLK